MNATQHALLKELSALSGGDALFRPSSIDRLIGCPGSIVLAARLPKIADKSTKPQREGTAAHKLAEDALNGIRQPEEYLDRTIVVDKDHPGGELVDEEMVEGVTTYLDEVAKRESPGTERFVERKLSLASLDPTDPLFAENRGTGDCVVVDRKNRKVTLLDLKYGKGHMVRGDAPQLKNYALMVMVSVGLDVQWDEIETCVVQPRGYSEAERIKPVSHDPASLMLDFLGELAGAMEQSLSVDAPLRPGSHCMWCKAQASCPAVADRAMHMARDAFAKTPLMTASSSTLSPPGLLLGTIDHPKPQASANVAVLPSPLSFDPSELATLLDRFDVYDAFKKAVQQRAAAVIQAGVTVPGWEMEPRTGNRRFKGETKATEEALLKMGLKVGDIYTDPKLKSPAQVEKALPKAKQPLLAPLIDRPIGEPALIRASASKLTLTDAPSGSRLGSLVEAPTR